MIVQGIARFDAEAFNAYISTPIDESLNLSNASLIEIIETMCSIKEHVAPNTRKKNLCYS